MSEYLSKNPDWREWTEFVSDKTGNKGHALWLSNARENRELFRKTGKAWAAQDLQGVHKGKTVVMLGASPALAKQVDQLRELRQDEDFIFFCISCNLKFLLDNGITPHYCITVDAHESQGDFWKDLDMERTKDVTLITNVFSYPEMLKWWKGPLKWLVLDSDPNNTAKKIRKWYKPVNGMGIGFPPLMSQYNVGTAISILIFEAQVIIFVGNELSYADEDVTYYVDRPDEKDEYQRLPAMDLYGNKVLTSRMLWALKFAMENFLDHVKYLAWLFNCTEAGIFGVSKRNQNERFIQQLTLKNGIAQARHIMRTGEPFSIGKSSIIEIPNTDTVLSLDKTLQEIGR